ncbi:MAG: hypothetical protein QX191_02425 [Methylococcaceae bacterium]
MKTLEFKCLLGDEYRSPYELSVVEFIVKDSEGSLLLDEFLDLYEAIKYEFSSPGNSDTRRLINDLNWYYLDNPAGSWTYLNNTEARTPDFHIISKGNDLLNNDYDRLMIKLLAKAATYKFRELNDEQLQLLSTIDINKGCLLTSSKLNKDGMKVVLNSFTNMPLGLMDILYVE